jgi:hypothetical protein
MEEERGRPRSAGVRLADGRGQFARHVRIVPTGDGSAGGVFNPIDVVVGHGIDHGREAAADHRPGGGVVRDV